MKLPVVSGSEAVRAFRRIGYESDEQNGSHKELAKGTLRALIREAGLTVEEFVELL
jgi:predicted RNA binding protein YcfA (HicA-like mRNA interferase family)